MQIAAVISPYSIAVAPDSSRMNLPYSVMIATPKRNRPPDVLFLNFDVNLPLITKTANDTLIRNVQRERHQGVASQSPPTTAAAARGPAQRAATRGRHLWRGISDLHQSMPEPCTSAIDARRAITPRRLPRLSAANAPPETSGRTGRSGRGNAPDVERRCSRVVFFAQLSSIELTNQKMPLLSVNPFGRDRPVRRRRTNALR
jgi:hypothetical protein